VRVISQLAARSDVTLLKIEPRAVAGSGLDAMRPLHVIAQADFDHAIDFLEGLSSLPVLVVSDELTLKRQGEALSVSATLHSFNAIHPVPSAARSSLRNDPDASIPTKRSCSTIRSSHRLSHLHRRTRGYRCGSSDCWPTTCAGSR
jgi:hypothetical protein